ncbi:hypothetical protein WUBG_00209 [Wuchereria bancrofti]|uniref:SAYSvFN domain-containing protein n=1 Tax=Wuchereria bancrofti TaxID=6293 RepID=J9BMS7_WUCBA|nr:hypothetical protein WUBG_00209 [Wuchereria bancrofti]
MKCVERRLAEYRRKGGAAYGNRKRKSGELSAYSIFNPHCERLPGTLTAEHFERDLLKRKILRV